MRPDRGSHDAQPRQMDARSRGKAESAMSKQSLVDREAWPKKNTQAGTETCKGYAREHAQRFTITFKRGNKKLGYTSTRQQETRRHLGARGALCLLNACSWITALESE